MTNHTERIEHGGMVEFSPMSILFDNEAIVQEVIQQMVTRDKSNTFHGVIALHTGGLPLLYDTRKEVEVYEASKIIEQAIRNTTGGGHARGRFRTAADIDKIEEAAEALRTATQQEENKTSEHLVSSKPGDTAATRITSESNEATTTGGTKRDRGETFDLSQHAKDKTSSQEWAIIQKYYYTLKQRRAA